MRSAIALVISVIAVALSVCTNIAHRSKREISYNLALLLTALIPPVLGNLLIIIAHGRLLATIGSYVYFLGMDYVMYALLAFTLKYCRIKPSWPWGMRLVYLVLVLDGVQLLCNPFFGHAFALEEIVAYGAPYFRLVPYLGQIIHRVVDYGIFFAVLGIFLHKTIYSPRIYTERYSIILASMIFTGLWETFYIFSRTPIDRSMIGYGVFGLLVFYFSLYYRPMRLLDHMLAKIASSMNEALFFFDDGDRCVWANEKAESFAGISEDSYDDCQKAPCDFPIPGYAHKRLGMRPDHRRRGAGAVFSHRKARGHRGAGPHRRLLSQRKRRNGPAAHPPAGALQRHPRQPDGAVYQGVPVLPRV